ncbi:MAG TPA: heme exporter protein CcmB [Thermoanaerobaculia bacterium]|nr:heme exporter protein CcmB [Thermoanaerobaculia bacterium]
MSPASSNWLAEVGAVFAKEWRAELRTRYALNTFALFGLTTLFTASASLGTLSIPLAERAAVLPVILWLILLFALTAGLPRTFVHEEETHTATALRLAASPVALFVGKQAYNLVLTLALEALVAPLFLVLFDLEVQNVGVFLATLVAGAFGLATGSTLVAAMIAAAQGKSTLFAVLALPVLLPLLLFTVQLSRSALTGEAPGQALPALLLYDASVAVAALLLFPVVWNP